MKQSVADVLAELSYKTGDFTLSSGSKSNEYLDVKSALLSARRGNWLAYAVRCGVLDVADSPIDVLAGVETGGLLLACLVGNVMLLPALAIRKDDRSHGATRYGIDGLDNLVHLGGGVGGGMNGALSVWLLEDVITTGQSVIAAIDKLRCVPNLRLDGVAALVDREQSGIEAIKAHAGLDRVFALATLTQIREAAAALKAA